MLEGFDKYEDKNLQQSPKRSRLPIILILIILIIIITMFVLIIYLVVQNNNANNSTENTSNEEKKISDRAPIIGITGMRIPDGEETLYTADQTQIHYILAVEKSGGIPISLPVLQSFNSETIKRQVELIDALLIQGGLDVSPSLYNEDPVKELELTDIQTDNYLIEVIKQAVERKIPILGICRGIHILNVAFGGNLYQDLKYANLDSNAHRQPFNDTCSYKHTINVEKNSVLSKIFPNNETLYVNSLHHQAIKDLASKFIVDAKSDDGIIEAMHLNDENQWVFAVQFHPEQNMRCNNDFLPLFKELINQAKLYKSKS